MIYPFKSVLYDCKQATLLSIKKDQGRISFLERIKLSYHLLYCDPCRNFIAQSHQIDHAGKKLENLLASRPPFSLPLNTRDRIQKEIDKYQR